MNMILLIGGLFVLSLWGIGMSISPPEITKDKISAVETWLLGCVLIFIGILLK